MPDVFSPMQALQKNEVPVIFTHADRVNTAVDDCNIILGCIYGIGCKFWGFFFT